MTDLHPGAVKLAPRHVSIRVPWRPGAGHRDHLHEQDDGI